MLWRSKRTDKISEHGFSHSCREGGRHLRLNQFNLTGGAMQSGHQRVT